MTNEKILEVVSEYMNVLDDAVPTRNQQASTIEERRGHLLWMCYRIREFISEGRREKAFISEGRREKAFRWLGFIQGTLWCLDTYSIEEMKNHNRPD